MPLTDDSDPKFADLAHGLSPKTIKYLQQRGHRDFANLHGVNFADLLGDISFDQAKTLLKLLISLGHTVRFDEPDWTEEQWHHFVTHIVERGIVKWKEVAMALCGELNPPQVGTAIASNKSFQKHYPPREIMKHVMAWFYQQDGKCALCGTRLFLEADHKESKQSFREAGRNPEEADTVANLQLLCKRCNVIKRPSHALGGISFAPAQSVLVWILLAERPQSKLEFYKQCRRHGLTMANIRFDEAWALAEWLKKDGKY
jgi:hypothetical protein